MVSRQGLLLEVGAVAKLAVTLLVHMEGGRKISSSSAGGGGWKTGQEQFIWNENTALF